MLLLTSFSFKQNVQTLLYTALTFMSVSLYCKRCCVCQLVFLLQKVDDGDDDDDDGHAAGPVVDLSDINT